MKDKLKFFYFLSNGFPGKKAKKKKRMSNCCCCIVSILCRLETSRHSLILVRKGNEVRLSVIEGVDVLQL